MRPSLDRTNTLPDMLSGEAFELLMGSLPSGDDSDDLTLKVLNTSIPGFSTESMEVNLNSQVLRFRGRKMYPRSLSVTFVDDVTASTMNKLQQWGEFIVGTYTANSEGYKSDYSVHADLVLYDTTGSEVKRWTMWYFFLQDIGDTSLSSENTTAVNITATFSYDFMTSTGINYVTAAR